jgi:hypothetical protein
MVMSYLESLGVVVVGCSFGAAVIICTVVMYAVALRVKGDE